MKKVFASVLCLVLLLSMLPMTVSAADEGWSFDASTGTLTITDNVIMGDLKPWSDLKDSIKKVVYVQSNDNSFFRFTEIPQFAFMGYTALEEVVLPEGLKTIRSQAFENCTSLKTVNIPADVIEIESSAFNGCTALENVVLSTQEPYFDWGQKLYIRSRAFGDCTSLKTLDLSTNCGFIDMEAFAGCTALETISLPKTLGYIGQDAFKDCAALQTINYEGTEADWEKINNSPGMDQRVFIAHLKPLVKYQAVNQNPFKDVSADAYYADAVAWAVAQGVTGGVGGGLFGPDNTCTRGQVVMFLWRAAGSPDAASPTNPFDDVYPYDYYFNAVLWAVQNGITGGTSPTTFSPEAPCTRAQVMTFLWAAKDKPGFEEMFGNPFVDVAEDAYYYAPVRWAVDQSVTGGTSATTFSPDAPCTRAQIVTFLYKVYG